MGSSKIQGELWGEHSKDWSSIQESTALTGYEDVLNLLKLSSRDKVLDVGCGSGLFCRLAHKKGADVTGIDACSPLLEEAKRRDSTINYIIGEMEELPFEDNYFDVVCAFNSIQYAESVENAIVEFKRVLKDSGKLVIMIWGNKEDCEAAAYLKIIGRLLPPPPPSPGAGGPFALSDNQLLENIIENCDLNIIDNTDISSIWDYENAEIALRGLLSAGPATKAVHHSGFDKVYDATAKGLKLFTQSNGRVIYNNKFRVVIAVK